MLLYQYQTHGEMFQLLAQLSKPKSIDDNQMKKKIMEQYGFVDKEEDSRYHRPNISKKCVSGLGVHVYPGSGF
jgi:hypothetical protein